MPKPPTAEVTSKSPPPPAPHRYLPGAGLLSLYHLPPSLNNNKTTKATMSPSPDVADAPEAKRQKRTYRACYPCRAVRPLSPHIADLTPAQTEMQLW